MRVIRIGERYSISTDEVETYDLLPVKTYVVMYNDKDDFCCWCEIRKTSSALWYGKGAVVMLGDSLLLDYDDYVDDIKIEKSEAKYLAFVKSKRNPVHYIV